MMPRRAAVSTTVFGPSTWQVMTSTPWSIRLLAASASLTGIDQSPVKMTWVVIFGLALGAERVGVDVAQHLRDRLGGDEAELAGLAGMAGDDAGDILGLVDIAEIAAAFLGSFSAQRPPQCSKRILGYFAAIFSICGL